MPKDEFDFDDPLELNGVALLTAEDTSGEMAVCFIEEFMRLGYNHKQVLALFRNTHYLGPNLVLQNRGEPFVRELISETFARWGRPFAWANAPGKPGNDAPPTPEEERTSAPNPGAAGQSEETGGAATDPMGAPAPKLKL